MGEIGRTEETQNLLRDSATPRENPPVVPDCILDTEIRHALSIPAFLSILHGRLVCQAELPPPHPESGMSGNYNTRTDFSLPAAFSNVAIPSAAVS